MVLDQLNPQEKKPYIFFYHTQKRIPSAVQIYSEIFLKHGIKIINHKDSLVIKENKLY